MFRCAIIGVSGFGHVHYQDLLRWTEKGIMSPVAATIINQDEESEKVQKLSSLNCKIYLDYRQMLTEFKGKLDLVMIPTGIHLHAPMTIAACEAGANVLVEKPAAATVCEVDAMITARDIFQTIVAVGFQNIYDTLSQEVKQFLLEGGIGPIRCIKCYGLWPRRQSYYTRNRWAGRLRLSDQFWVLDSPANNAFAHFLIQMLYFAGSTLEKVASVEEIEVELYRSKSIESFDTIALRAKLPRKITLYYYVTHACAENQAQPIIHIIGERGIIEWTSGRASCTIPSTAHLTPSSLGSSSTLTWQGVANIRDRMIEQVLAAIQRKPSFICSLEMAREHTRVINLIHQVAQPHAVPSTYLQVLDEQKDPLIVISQIESIIRQAFEQEKLFSELGIPWSVTPAKGNIHELHAF